MANQKDLARTSSFPGRTREINIFLINEAFYLVDLPGYGFAKVGKEAREKIQKMVSWYLFDSDYVFKKAVLIIDAKVGATKSDMEMLRDLEKGKKEILIVANKIDKIKKSEYLAQTQKIKDTFSIHKVILYSAENKIGVGDLVGELLKQDYGNKNYPQSKAQAHG